MAKRATKRNASGRFQRCVAKVSARPGVASPRGVCAAAGRKKYGAKKFADMAAAGKRKNTSRLAAKDFRKFGKTAGEQEAAGANVNLSSAPASERFRFIWDRALSNGEVLASGRTAAARVFTAGFRVGYNAKRKKNTGKKRKTLRRKNSGGFGSIRVGSRVTILSYHGQKQSGRAVMRGPHGWVLNLGGPHGTPGIATPENVVAVSAPRKKANRARPKQAGGVNRKVRRAAKAGATAKAAYKAKQSYSRAYQVSGRGLHTKNTGRKVARRKNPLDAAQNVYRKFHGRDADKVLTVTEPMHVHKYLSGIGDLVGLQILTHDGRAKVTLKFEAGAVLAQNEKRNQLFIRGGDQSVNLKDFGITGPHHELENLGEVIWISYYTRKDHLAPEDGGEAIYRHQFGRKKPTLIYDTLNKKMELAGGGYDIPDEGIDR